MRKQLLLAAGSSVLCLAVTGLSAWAWSSSRGAVLITVNFWFVEPSSAAGWPRRPTRARPWRPRCSAFYLRLGLTGAALYALLGGPGPPRRAFGPGCR